jgi:hypothetical protein
VTGQILSSTDACSRKHKARLGLRVWDPPSMSGKGNQHTLRAGQETGDAANQDEKKKGFRRPMLIEPPGARSTTVQQRAQEPTERTRTREIDTLACRGN